LSTLPLTVALGERLFSKLKLIKEYLYSTSGKVDKSGNYFNRVRNCERIKNIKTY